MAVASPIRQRPGSKELNEIARSFKQGYRFERSGGGHWRIVDRQGRFVEHRGRPISVSDSPSPGSLNAFKEQVLEASITRGTKIRITDEAVEARKEANRLRVKELSARRQVEANELRDRYRVLFVHMGGLETPGLPADLAHVASVVARDMPAAEGEAARLKTPDLLQNSAHRMLHGAPVDSDYHAIWVRLAEMLEKAPDVVGEWYTLVRESRGLPSDTVEVRLPKGAGDEWPFRVELLPLDALLIDRDSYQRPVSWSFVRREASRFDPSLVGTIDVSQRSPSTFAVLDGQQRSEIVRLVGKSSIWASIYVGLDLQSEALFFLRKNRDRKTMHPYYTFRAQLTSGDEETVAQNTIVEKHGYKLAIAAPTSDRTDNIAAIAAIKVAYGRKLPDGSDTLDPTLEILRSSTYGRQGGQDAILIRGVSSTLVERPDADRELLARILREIGPELVLGRARDLKRNANINGEQGVVRVLTSEYDREARKRKR